MEKFFSPFYLVTFSPWPLMTSLGLMVLIVGGVKYFFLGDSLSLFFLGLILLFMNIYQWWRDVVRESTYQGLHSMYISSLLYFSFLMFIISELFFFISFFWSFFHMMLCPSVDLGDVWPPLGISTFNSLGIPLLNSFILVSSGMTITASHYNLVISLYKKSSLLLSYTLLLGLIFTMFQYYEYNCAVFTMTDSTYGSMFFLMTGFHGIHVIIGSLFLLVIKVRMMNNHFSSSHHLGFELASWYWHFVDVVWLFLYIIVYWWCS